MDSKSVVSPVIADIHSGMKRGKVVSLENAMRVIRDGDTVSVNGFVGYSPEELLRGLEDRFLKTGEPKNLTLIVAAGIGDGKEKDVNRLAHVEFKPIMKNVRRMDERIFKLPPMGLKDDLLSIPIPERLTYDPATNIFYVNFEGLHVRNGEDIEAIRSRVTEVCAPLGRRVKTIVNYDNFSIAPDLEDEYVKMVKYVVSEYYSDVTRYTTSAFLRMKLGDELKKRNLAAHIFQSKEEAGQALE
ncbi:MAG: hypothetical protein GX874_00855 [Smithella sp.]|nr:hypothetical protein [Smithella sp.]